MSEIRGNEMETSDIRRDAPLTEKPSDSGLNADLDLNYDEYLQEGKNVSVEKKGEGEIKQPEKKTDETDSDIDTLIDQNYDDYIRSALEKPPESE